MKTIMLAAPLAVASTGAFAQAKQYFVVHDTAAKKCMVGTAKPPAVGSTTVVAEGETYTSEPDANNAMKTMAVRESM